MARVQFSGHQYAADSVCRDCRLMWLGTIRVRVRVTPFKHFLYCGLGILWDRIIFVMHVMELSPKLLLINMMLSKQATTDLILDGQQSQQLYLLNNQF